MDNVLLEAREKAHSFPGLEPPNNAKLIGQIEEVNDTYFYYRDDVGNFYYISGRTRRFEEEMQQRVKEKRKNVGQKGNSHGSGNFAWPVKKNISVS